MNNIADQRPLWI